MKYSIVIVAYKAPEPLLRCLASLAKNPPEANEAEIVLIDNSPEPIQIPNDLLHSLLLKYIRVILVQDGVNRGFAEGCNEGVRQSHGKYVVLVNPDTEVFPDWAERMEAHFGDKVGAVGPISNFVAGYQQYILHMKAAEPWEKVAKLAARGLSRRGVDTKLLIGFFLMIPRKVWDEMGGLDTAFFLGCDDLDLSLRLRDAGYSLVIASDVFVYHEGHACFYASGSEHSMTLNKQSEKAMLAKLRAKYGDSIPSSTELWGCEILPTYVPKRQTLSVCMIVRKEVENLSILIPQLAFADEVVLVDTAQIPETLIGICGIEMLKHTPGTDWKQEGMYSGTLIRFYHNPLLSNFSDEIIDFAAARNFAISKCTGDYILWLDADDRVPVESAKLIRAAMDHPGPLTQAKQAHFALRLRDHTPEGRFAYADQPRVFPRLYGLEFEGRVHESYARKAAEMGLTMISTQIILDHTGYKDAKVLAKKHERNLRLLHMEPDSPLKLYQMGGALSGLGRFTEARAYFVSLLKTKWAEPLDSEFVDQVRFRIAWDLYKENGDAVAEMAEYLTPNQKPDSLYFRAELAFKDMDLVAAKEMYSLYASYGPIMDFYGTDQDLFTSLCRSRLEILGMILDMPKEEWPSVFEAIRAGRKAAAVG